MFRKFQPSKSIAIESVKSYCAHQIVLGPIIYWELANGPLVSMIVLFHLTRNYVPRCLWLPRCTNKHQRSVSAWLRLGNTFCESKYFSEVIKKGKVAFVAHTAPLNSGVCSLKPYLPTPSPDGMLVHHRVTPAVFRRYPVMQLSRETMWSLLRLRKR